MTESSLPPGGPPNAEFREAIIELAKQAREEDQRADHEAKRRHARRPFAQFVRWGVALIVLQAGIYLYLSHERGTPTAKKIEHGSLFSANTCNAVLSKTYWQVVTFQRDQGHPPKDLEEMLGKYLDKLPSDPVTGKALEYSTSGERFELHCPGPQIAR